MALIEIKDAEYLKQYFSEQLEHPVTIHFFTQGARRIQVPGRRVQEQECQFCRETGELVGELAALSDKIAVEVHDFVVDQEAVQEFGIDKIPAIAIAGARDYGVRFYGIPSGYEFTSLIEDIVAVSKGDSHLTQASREALADLKGPVHIQVFVTPTCPFCPGVVRLAHQLAIESDRVTGDMVEAIEYPHLAQKYGVQGVPKVVINEAHSFTGAMSESRFVQEVLKAARN